MLRRSLNTNSNLRPFGCAKQYMRLMAPALVLSSNSPDHSNLHSAEGSRVLVVPRPTEVTQTRVRARLALTRVVDSHLYYCTDRTPRFYIPCPVGAINVPKSGNTTSFLSHQLFLPPVCVLPASVHSGSFLLQHVVTASHCFVDPIEPAQQRTASDHRLQ